MLHAHSFIPAPMIGRRSFADSVVLTFEDRRRRRGTVTTLGGLEVLVDLAEAPALAHGDALELDDGRLVEVVAEAEELLEIRGRDPLHLVRLAWHLGNRHLETEIGPKWLRIRRDHVVADMLEGLGARVTEIAGPFQPEGGAYSAHAPGSQGHEGHPLHEDHGHGDHGHGHRGHGHHAHEHHGYEHHHHDAHGHHGHRHHGHDHHDHGPGHEHPDDDADHEPHKPKPLKESDPRKTGPEDNRRDRMNDAPQFR
jgi:urease accessory protein